MIETGLRLTEKAAAEFQKKMLEGDEESQKLRDAFLNDIDASLDENGNILVNCPDLNL
jgi:hypothetical protein